MNFYPFHLGDYAAHTAHLDLLEDLAYRRMLDVYYLREGPLPADPAEVARLIRMRAHQQEVAAVLSEFFERTDDGWRHARCDEEIASAALRKASSEEKAAHESERMRRHREKRSEMFAALRAVGIVPAWDIPMKDLQRLHDENCGKPETDPQREQVISEASPATAIPIPIPIPKDKARAGVADQHESDSAVDNSDKPQDRTRMAAESACRAMAAVGMSSADPADDRLLALLRSGVTEGLLVAAARKAVGQRKGWGYALKAAEGMAADALAVGKRLADAAAQGAAGPGGPASADPESRSAIEAEGVAKGLGPWDERREQWGVYKRRVRADAAPPVASNVAAMVARGLAGRAAA